MIPRGETCNISNGDSCATSVSNTVLYPVGNSCTMSSVELICCIYSRFYFYLFLLFTSGEFYTLSKDEKCIISYGNPSTMSCIAGLTICNSLYYIELLVSQPFIHRGESPLDILHVSPQGTIQDCPKKRNLYYIKHITRHILIEKYSSKKI